MDLGKPGPRSFFDGLLSLKPYSTQHCVDSTVEENSLLVIPVGLLPPARACGQKKLCTKKSSSS